MKNSRAACGTSKSWKPGASPPSSRPALHAERAKVRALEQFVRHAARGILQDVPAVEARGRPRAPGQDPHGRGQPAPGRLRRQEIHQPRPVLPRSDPGRQHRPDEGRREIRVSARLQVFHLRHLVDSPGHHALHCRPGAHHPHPGAHDRDHEQALARPEAAHPGTGPRAHARGDRGRNAHAGLPHQRAAQDGPAARLAARAGRRRRRRERRRFHRRQDARRTRPT